MVRRALSLALRLLLGMPLAAAASQICNPAPFLPACSTWAPMFAPAPQPDAILNLIPGAAQATELHTQSAARDAMEGLPIQVVPQPGFRYEYRESFCEASCLRHIRIDGPASVRWDCATSAVQIRPADLACRSRVLLSYHLTSAFHMREILGELTGEIRGTGQDVVELALSPDSRQIAHAVRAFALPEGNLFHFTTNGGRELQRQDLWVRISADLSRESCLTLTGFHLRCRVFPY